MTCERKRIYALYICTDVFLTFRTLAVELLRGLLRWLFLGGLSGAVSGEESERVKGREKKTDVLI